MKPQGLCKPSFVIRILLGVLLVSLASGCAARSAMMVPARFEVAKKIPGSVRVEEAVGGRETNPLWTSQISSTAFTEALTDSIARAGLFDSVLKQGNADYILNVTILRYDQPWIGLDLDIKMKTKWELTDAKKLTPVWSDTFETTYRAKVSDALVAAERLQKANEGAVRTNIAEGIKRLSQATF
ncbi:MAG: LPS assembly lipoprotein LptE [Sedimentisphaerales bacterium]